MRKATAMAEGVQRGAKRMKRRRGGKRERKKRAREAARQLQHSATPIAAGKAAATLSRDTAAANQRFPYCRRQTPSQQARPARVGDHGH
jgi:hypothetical protein